MSSVLYLLGSLTVYVEISRSNLLTPPRGWNSWISYRGCINESQVLENAESVVKYLKPYGYEYVVIDGGWSSGDNGTQFIDQYGRPRMYILQHILILLI